MKYKYLQCETGPTLQIETYPKITAKKNYYQIELPNKIIQIAKIILIQPLQDKIEERVPANRSR